MNEHEHYTPVGCGFYDMLEAAAVKRTRTEIRYLDGQGREAGYAGPVVDVFARGKEEFVRLDGGLEIRLDRLTSVNGVVNDQCRTG